MHEKAQDALTYVKKFGSADLFITITSNPKWREIQDNLLSRQSATDRYDLVSRVFKLKLNRLMKVLTKDKLFGAVKSYIYTVEWQKRGT